MQGQFSKFFYAFRYGDIFGSEQVCNPGLMVDFFKPLIPVDHPIANAGSMGKQVADTDGLIGRPAGITAVGLVKCFQDLSLCKFRDEFGNRVIQLEFPLFPEHHYCRGGDGGR